MVVEKQNVGSLFIGLPKELVEKNKLAPFMCGQLDSNEMRFKKFEKTVKIKVKLRKETLEFFLKYKKLCGYQSIDETVSNAVSKYFGDKEETLYFYPKDFLAKGFELIEDYEKALKKQPMQEAKK